MKTWKGQPAKHALSIKLDGVQATLKDGIVVSRNGKPLRNVDPSFLRPGKRYEVYCGSFKETISLLKSHTPPRAIRKDELYEIWPNTDGRITLPLTTNIEKAFKRITKAGGEGLVIDRKFKYKRVETHDVRIIAVLPGKGKHEGRMGALVTKHGHVGTGFTDTEREQAHWWRKGMMIEVACMEMTAANKFRKPRFVRIRWDKE